ncbi:MAG TPA: Gmad2 immunoglobulin-like domain-containing protein [Micromonosporaceae bacterium]|nr:Gmad2 immunoglobulin-like domain-containing protein [Micromonosporaceae bacterium]
MNEDMLRRALEAEVAEVEVQRDALAKIRRRIASPRTRWFPRPGALFAIGTGTVATVAAVAVGLAMCAPPQTDSPPTGTGGTTSPTGAPATQGGPTNPAGTGSPTPGAGSPTAPAGGATGALPVYYLSEDGGKLRLYREFHPLPLADGSAAAKTRSALTEMFTGRPYDPDYRGGWPSTARVRGVDIADGVVTVDLAGAGRNDVGSEAAHQAVQQLVWTVGAVVGGAPGVRLVLDGRGVGELWGSVDISGVLRRDPHIDVAGLVWLINPQEGQTVGRTFQVHVAGVAFEATVQLRVRQGDRTVDEQFVTLSAGPPSVGEARVSLTLAPGTYTLEAYELSAADGSVQHLDDHTFTVR